MVKPVPEGADETEARTADFATDRRTPHSFPHECSPAYPEVERVLLHSRTAPSTLRTAGSTLRTAVGPVIGVGDVTTAALHSALSGLAERQRVTADNIANINTPEFLAGRTDFESALRDSLSAGDTPSVSGGSIARSLEPTNTNGNNVNLDDETVIATETGLRYQLALNALDGKYSLLRTSLQAS
jgi:flagellar basal-body rod protein FlgB